MLLNYVGVGLITALTGAAAVSGAVAVLLFPLAPLILLFGIPFGFLFALPVTLIALPIAHHLSRRSAFRSGIMDLSGFAAGLVSPSFVLWAVSHIRGERWEASVESGGGLAVLSFIGGFAGLGCTPLFRYWLLKRITVEGPDYVPATEEKL